MAKLVDVYFDIETDWNRKLTVIGIKSSKTGLVQIIGHEITKAKLQKELPQNARLISYNGHCFDMPCIKKQLGINLREYFSTLDLRWICQRYGLIGGQKAIEQSIGKKRITNGIDGRAAIRLWERFLRGDEQALKVLLQYNAEDLDGLRVIKRHLQKQGWLAET